MNSLLSEPPGKLKNTGVGSLSLLQGIFPTQGSNPSLLRADALPSEPAHCEFPMRCLPPLEVRPSSVAPDPAESRGAPPPPQDPSSLRGTPGSSLNEGWAWGAVRCPRSGACVPAVSSGPRLLPSSLAGLEPHFLLLFPPCPPPPAAPAWCPPYPTPRITGLYPCSWFLIIPKTEKAMAAHSSTFA